MKTIALTLLAMTAIAALTGCGEPTKPTANGGSDTGTSSGAATSSGSGQSVELHGAGATFPAPLYAKWTAEYNKSNPNVKVDYQAIGSGGGIKGITDKTIQFGGSDAPMTDEQMAAAPGITHLPTVAGPVVMTYNLDGVANLTLNGEVIVGIYTGKITKWNDPKIAAINTAEKLPATEIVVVHRSDGSGTSWIFTNYLSKISADWKTNVGNATSVKWPAGLGGKGSDGVAAAVKNAAGGIGYVELAYAENAKLPMAALVNKAGKTVKPSMDGVIEAATNSATDFPADFRVSITDAPGDGSYPICGFTYLLIYQDLSYFKNKEMAVELMKFITWCETTGQEMAAPAYARLPEAMKKKVIERIESVVFDGHPITK